LPRQQQEADCGGLEALSGVTYKTGRLMCQRLHREMKGPFVRNLFIAMRGHRTPEQIFYSVFPDLCEP